MYTSRHVAEERGGEAAKQEAPVLVLRAGGAGTRVMVEMAESLAFPRGTAKAKLAEDLVKHCKWRVSKELL